MSPGQFGNYAVKKCGCSINEHSNESIVWIMNEAKGTSCYVPCRYRKLYYERVVRYCIKLQIDIISEDEYLSYE